MCVELKGEYVNTFFLNPVACFLYKAKDVSTPSYKTPSMVTPKLWHYYIATYV
jgi:hypothetical protein